MIINDYKRIRGLNFYNVYVLPLCLILSYQCFTNPHLAKLLALHNAHVIQADMRYLDEAYRQVLESVVLIGGIKTLLSTIVSSQGGIQFIIDVKVQLGNVLVEALNLINISWYTALAASISIKVSQLLLLLSKMNAAPMCGIFFILLAAVSFTKAHLPVFCKRLLSALRLFVFLFVCLHWLIPVSIYLVSLGTSALFSEHKKQTTEGFNAMLNTYQRVSGPSESHKKNHSLKHSRLHEHVLSTVSVLERSHLHAKEKNHHIIDTVVKHVFSVLCEHVLFPLLMMYVLFRVLRRQVFS